MQYEKPMLGGILVRRYKRFLADVQLDDGRELTVHCPNSGSMKECCEPGRPVVVSDSENPKRKLRYTLELIKMGRSWVGVHSALSNRLVAEWINSNSIPELRSSTPCRREVPYGLNKRSRIDLLLDQPNGTPCYVEIKHSTMRVDAHAAFPDAVTERGRKHLEDLQSVVAAGDRAVMFYAVGRADCTRFRCADEIDPAYGNALREATLAGVEIFAYRLRFSPRGVELMNRLPIDLD